VRRVAIRARRGRVETTRAPEFRNAVPDLDAEEAVDVGRVDHREAPVIGAGLIAPLQRPAGRVAVPPPPVHAVPRTWTALPGFRAGKEDERCRCI
jgi:hypothetical protein